MCTIMFYYCESHSIGSVSRTETTMKQKAKGIRSTGREPCDSEGIEAAPMDCRDERWVHGAKPHRPSHFFSARSHACSGQRGCRSCGVASRSQRIHSGSACSLIAISPIPRDTLSFALWLRRAGEACGRHSGLLWGAAAALSIACAKGEADVIQSAAVFLRLLVGIVSVREKNL